MTKKIQKDEPLENYAELAQKIAWEGGLGDYITDYGASSTDPELQQRFVAAKEALDFVEEYFNEQGIYLEDY